MQLSGPQPRGSLTTLRTLVLPLRPAPASRSQSCLILVLPDEILLEIFSYLHDITTACLQLTCRRFYNFQPLLSIADARHAYLSYSVSRDDLKSYFCFCCTKTHRFGYPCSSSTFKINLSWPWLEPRSTRLAGRCSIRFQDAHAIMSQHRYGHSHGISASSLYHRSDHNYVSTELREVTRVEVVKGQLMIKHYVRVTSHHGYTALRGLMQEGGHIVCDHSHFAKVKGKSPWVTWGGNLKNSMMKFMGPDSNTAVAAAKYPSLDVKCITCATDAQVDMCWVPTEEKIVIVVCSWYLLGRCEVPWDPVWMDHNAVRSSTTKMNLEREAGTVRRLWESEQGTD